MLKNYAEKIVRNMQFFLHVSAWKLFLAIYGSILSIFLINTVFHKVIYDNAGNFPFNVNYIFSFFYYFSWILLVHGVSVYFLWISTLFHGLYQKYDNKDAINVPFMQAVLGIILVTLFLLIPLVEIISHPPGVLMLVFYLSLFFSLFSLLYGLFLIAKMLAKVNNPDSSGEESIGIFLMLFFSFVGIFSLQHRIQEIFAEKALSEPEETKLGRAEDQGY